MLNGGNKKEPQRRSGSLFQRITGSGRERAPDARSPEADNCMSEETAKPDENTENKPENKPQQSHLAGVGPEDRIQSSEGGDDLLEIPAFLRRQAN